MPLQEDQKPDQSGAQSIRSGPIISGRNRWNKVENIPRQGEFSRADCFEQCLQCFALTGDWNDLAKDGRAWSAGSLDRVAELQSTDRLGGGDQLEAMMEVERQQFRLEV